MHDLESKLLPFELGIYHFDLQWKCFRVGSASLSFEKVQPEQMPSDAQRVYDSGDIYKVVFTGSIEVPVLQLIAKDGIFVSYVTVERDDAFPLLSVGDVTLLGKKISIRTVYDRKRNCLTVNGAEHSLEKNMMRLIRDPVSHVLHLLFKPQKDSGTYSCGYFNDSTGKLHSLDVHFVREENTFVGKIVIPAHTYVLNTSVQLELPYQYDATKDLFMPSLKEKVAFSHSFLGKVLFDYKNIEKKDF